MIKLIEVISLHRSRFESLSYLKKYIVISYRVHIVHVHYNLIIYRNEQNIMIQIGYK